MVAALSCAVLAGGCGRLKPAAAPPADSGDAGVLGDAGAGDDTGAAGDAAAAADAAAPSVALAVMSNLAVTFVAADGSTRVAYRFENQPLFEGIALGTGIAARAGYVAATASWWVPTGCSPVNGLQVCPELDLVVFLDLAGRVLWEKMFTRQASSADLGPGLFVGDGGDVLLVHGTGIATLVTPDGRERGLPPGMTLLARPFAGPALLVRAPVGDAGAAALAWLYPGELLQPVDPPLSVEAPLDAFDAGDELDFAATDAAGAGVIVHARPGQTTVLPAAGLGGGAAAARSGPWRAAADGPDVVRFNLVTGTVERFTWAFPDGKRSLGWGIAADGALVQALRDDAVAAVFVSPDAASGWTRIGLTMAEVEQIQVQDTAGTFLVDALGTNDFFVPQQSWPPVSGGEVPQLLQTSDQLVRPVDGVATQISPRWSNVVFTRDGRRAAYWEATDSSTRLVIHDVASGAKTPVPGIAASAEPQMVWLE
jgi:hypothetical protein